MSDLRPEDRALLELARGGHDPSDADRGRVRAALVAQLGVGTGLAAATAAAAAPAAAGLSIATKVIATIAIVGALTSGGIAAYRTARRPEPRAAATVRGIAPPAAPAPSVVPAPVATVLVAPDTVALPPPRAARAAAPLRATADSPTTLEAEIRLVRQGVSALHAGDGTTALALFDEHARRFPNGALAEERAVERVLALCELGRSDDARAAGAAFLRDHAGSPLTARVRASCAMSSGPPPNP